MLGIPNSGNPGDVNMPATLNSNGSIDRGRFDAPADPSGVSVPISE